MFAFAVSRRGHETEADLRALELCGDGEALIRALRALHSLALIPPRDEARNELLSTHPTLARRVRRLHAAMRTEAASPDGLPLLVTELAGDGALSFDVDGLRVARGLRVKGELASAARIVSFPYGELRSIHLEVHGSAYRVIAVGATRLTLAVTAEDALRIEQALSYIDSRLADGTPQLRGGPVLRVLALPFAFVLATRADHPITLAALCLLCAIAPSKPVLRGLALAFAAGALHTVWRFALTPASVLASSLPRDVLLALLCVWLQRRAQREQAPRLLRAALAPPVLAWFAVMLPLVRDPLALHLALREVQLWAVTLPMFAAVLVRREAKLAIAALWLAGISAWALPPEGEPFFADGPELSLISSEARPVNTVELPGPCWRVGVSPDGGWLYGMFTREDTVIAMVSDERLELHADDAVFIGTDRILTSRGDRGRLQIAARRLDAARKPYWERTLEAPDDASLWADGDRYQVRFHDNDLNEVRTLVGTIGQPPDIEATFAIPTGGFLHTAGPNPWLLAETNGPASVPERPLRALRWLSKDSIVTYGTAQLWRISNELPAALLATRQDVQCVPRDAEGRRALCMRSGDALSRFYELDMQRGSVRALGHVKAELDDFEIHGEHLIGTLPHGAAVIDLAGRRARLVAAPPGRKCRTQTSLEPGWLTVASSCPQSTTVRLYELERLF